MPSRETREERLQRVQEDIVELLWEKRNNPNWTPKQEEELKRLEEIEEWLIPLVPKR